MTDTAIDQRFEFGRVVGQTFGLIGRNFVLFVLLALIFVGLPQFGYLCAQAYVFQSQPALALWVTLSGIIVSVVTTYILQGALTRAAVDDLSGRGVNVGAAIGDGFGYFFPLFIVALLVTIGTGISLIALIIPALIVAVRWAVSAPVVVIERMGPTGSMGRSAELSEGHRWAIFGLLLIYAVFAYAVQIGVVLGMNAVGIGITERFAVNAAGLIYACVTAVSAAIVTLVSTVGSASLYFELRRVKDGVGVEDLAKVFD